MAEPVGDAELGGARGADHRPLGQGTHLAFLASAASGGGVNPELDAHLHRRHGVEAERVLPELAAAGVGPRRGDRRDQVARPQQRDRTRPCTSTRRTAYQVYSNLVRLNPAKELASVVLPNESRLKIFDWQIVDQPLPPVPTGSAWAPSWSG